MAHDDDREKDGLAWKDELTPVERKIAEYGYPGLGPSTSQADVMAAEANMPGMYTTSLAANNTKGHHICDYCRKAYNPVIPHECGEMREAKRMGISVYSDGTMDKNAMLETIGEPAVWVEQTSHGSAQYEIRNIPNDQAMRVVLDVLPKALELYMKKSKDYGGNVMSRRKLGIKACIPDMNRKFEKLIDAIWDGKPLQFEQPDEILMDLLGHILIILDEMQDKDETT